MSGGATAVKAERAARFDKEKPRTQKTVTLDVEEEPEKPRLAKKYSKSLSQRAGLALRQVVLSGTETALRERTGGLVQDFLRRDAEAEELLGKRDLEKWLLEDSSGSEDEPRKEDAAATGRRSQLFSDRSFWRRARQIACFEYVSERLRNDVSEFWKEQLPHGFNGRERAQRQAREILSVVTRLCGLQKAVGFQAELSPFWAVLQEKREEKKQGRDGKGTHEFWSIYHKEDSKWTLPVKAAPAHPAPPAPYRHAIDRQLPVAAPDKDSESEVHAALKSRRSQVARKVLQHRSAVDAKRLPQLQPKSTARTFASTPDIQDAWDDRPMTRQERGYFDLGRFLDKPRKPKRGERGSRPASRALPSIRPNEGIVASTPSPKPLRETLSLPSLERMPLDTVAGPFLQPWQSQVRTECGQPEPEAEEDSATMHYIRVCRALGVVPTAAVLEMVRSRAIASGEFLMDDELLAMSTMIGHLDSIAEVCLADSAKLSDGVLQRFLRELFGRPAMDSLEKLSLARCRGAGSKAMPLLVGLLVESNGLYKLRNLDISGIRISSSTMTSLCRAVHLHPAIRSLHLQDTGLGMHPTAAQCLEELLNAPSMEVLGLGWNCFSEEALRALGDMLASHKRLRELYMANCDSCQRSEGKSSTHRFLEGLYRNSSLKMLDISMNRLAHKSALIIEDSLAKHAKLQELYIGQNPLGKHGLRCLLRLLSLPSCGLRRLEALGCQGADAQELSSFQATEPTGYHTLDLNLAHGRSLLRLLYKTCESLRLDLKEAFQRASYVVSERQIPFPHPSGKDGNGVYPVPVTGVFSFFFCIDAARRRLAPTEGLEGRFRGPRPVGSIYLDQHFALLRRKLTLKKVVPLLSQFKSLKGRPDEQKLILDALSADFALDYECLAMLCQESFNSIDALCHLMPGVCRSQMRLFLALTHLPRLREYLKVYKRCERLLLFNADCPTGRYALNMSVPSDYAVAEMLKMLDAWEASMAKEAGLQDRSQHGNWSSVRNCTYLNQSLLSLTDCLLPNHETLRLDFVTWRRPKDARALPADRWEGMMVHLSQAPLASKAKAQALRGVADRIFLTSMQCRQLLGMFEERTSRVEALCSLVLRLTDPQNMKMIASRVEWDEWEELRGRLGTLSLFPYIQPEQHQFVLDTSRYEDRIAASLVVRMNMKESKRLGNIRNPSLVLIGGNQFQFDRGVPAGWTNTSAIPQGTLRLQYMCAPEDHLIDFRYELLAQYGGWQADPKAKIIWWAYLQAVPEPVVTFLIHVLRHFRDDLRAAFQMIDGQADTGNGKLTLREFKLAVASLGWKEFMDPERATQIFRYLDPDGGGTISYAEWQVMEEFLKELQLSILELLQHVYCTFGSVEVAHDFLDKDGSSSVDEEEWAQATKEMGYFGPSGIIYKYLCADQVQGQTSGLTKERWQKAVDIWTRRKIIFQRILG